MIRIGYAVEGWRDRAFLQGLAARPGWCPGAVLKEIRYRGRGGPSLKGELAKTCKQALLDGDTDFIVILRDANKEDWQAVRTRESGRIPEQARHCTVYAVAARNIEDWLGADLGYLAQQLATPVEDLRAGDVQDALARIVGARATSEGETRIAAIVREAPLNRWIQCSRSFEAFYEDVRGLAKQSGACQIPNERDR